MRENPFLGQNTLKSQEIRKWGERVTQSVKFNWEWYSGSSREFLVENASLRNTTY
jgi:hypothetical protein